MFRELLVDAAVTVVELLVGLEEGLSLVVVLLEGFALLFCSPEGDVLGEGGGDAGILGSLLFVSVSAGMWKVLIRLCCSDNSRRFGSSSMMGMELRPLRSRLTRSGCLSRSFSVRFIVVTPF